MSIQFNQIPGNIRVPFTYFEVNPGQAPYQTNAQLLLIGQKTPSGTALAAQPIIVFGNEDSLFGSGSMLASMYKMARFLAPFQEIWALPLNDGVGTTAAVGRVTLNKWPYTTNDSMTLYIGDIRVSVPVSVVSTPLTIASQLVSSVAALLGTGGQIVTGCSGIQVTAATVAGTAPTVTFAVPAITTGVTTTLQFSIAGIPYGVSVLAADTTTGVATKMAAGINLATSQYGFTATSLAANLTITTGFGTAGTFLINITNTTTLTTATYATLLGGADAYVTLTANNTGYLGNSIRIETALTYGDSAWANANTTIVQPTGGAGQPVLNTALSNLGSMPFDFIVNPYNDVYTLGEVDTFLQQRWGPYQQLYGLQLACFDGTAAQALAQTATINSPYTYVISRYLGPAPTYLWAAALGARAAQHLQDAPELSRPMQTLALTGMHGPKLAANAWSITQRQSFYFGGVTGYTLAKDGTVRLDRVVSTYLTNAYGQVDMTWLDINTLAQNMYALRFINQALTSTYPRSALADSNPGSLQGVVTPKDVFNLVAHSYSELCNIGVMQNADLFAQQLIVERNSQDPNRVDAYLPFDVMNQLRIFAGNATTYLQFPL